MVNTYQPTASSEFRGPLFVVGMPRSGTKLLRGLLNQHPLIRINTTETDFLPYWINHWGQFGDLANWVNFQRFYRQACKLNYMKIARHHEKLIGRKEWYDACESFDAAGVFEALMKHDLDITGRSDLIWGDKTPSYIARTSLIKTAYPSAKFIHIVRDVRDFCLSINKAWNKSPYRAAQRWADDVSAARKNGNQHGDYLEIKYESLIDDAEVELRRACGFLGIGYHDEMGELTRSVEKIGDATGAFIDKNNTGKYKSNMSDSVREKVESIARNALIDFGYPVDKDGPCKRISALEGGFYQFVDGIRLIRRRKVKSITDVVTNANRQSP